MTNLTALALILVFILFLILSVYGLWEAIIWITGAIVVALTAVPAIWHLFTYLRGLS